MRIEIDLGEELQKSLNDYFEGKISYIGLNNGFKLLDAIKNGFTNHHESNVQEYAKDFKLSEKQAEKELLVDTDNDFTQYYREFEEIEVTYPPEDLCTYPEYKGKPYFSIKYKEDGECFVGYGTYNPEVLSEYIKKYFIASSKTYSRSLTEIDLIELEHRYGKEVEFVVRDMLSGKNERFSK